MIPRLVIIFGLVSASTPNITDQQTSESNHDQVAILKQIRKVNDDGSYTFGYEADDGSFKVETRDVLGNVKGTFGFIDANGEIKRVTYSSSNDRGFKATTISPVKERVSVIQSIPLKANRSSIVNLLKKSNSSSLILPNTSPLSSTPTASNLVVIQSIPPRNTIIKTTLVPHTTSRTTKKISKVIFDQYLKGTKNRQMFNKQLKRQPSQNDEETSNEQYDNGHQNFHNPKYISVNPNNKVTGLTQRTNYVTQVTFDDVIQPITERFRDYKSRSKINAGSTNFRRQIDEKAAVKVRDAQEDNNRSEASDVYNEQLLSTTRPLFTTTATTTSTMRKLKIIPRNNSESSMLSQVSKAKEYQVNEDDLIPTKFETFKNVNTKLFSGKKFVDKSPVIPSNIYVKEPFSVMSATMPYNGRIATATEYMMKELIEPTYIDYRQLEKNNEYIPLGIIFGNTPSRTKDDNDEVIPIDRRVILNIRGRTKQPTHESREDEENMDYLPDINAVPLPIQSSVQATPISSPYAASTSNIAAAINSDYVIRKEQPNQYIGASLHHDMQSQINSNPIQAQQQRQQYQGISPTLNKDYIRKYFYRNIVFPSQPLNSLISPLSRRNFKILLKRLLASQYGVQALEHPKTYLNHALDDDHFNPSYHTPPSRYSLLYGDHQPGAIPVTVFNKYNEGIPILKANIPRTMATMSVVGAPSDIELSSNLQYQEPKYIKTTNKKIYHNSVNAYEPLIDINDYTVLPLHVREALLLKILQLAINNKQSILQHIPTTSNNIGTNVSSLTMSKGITTPIYRKAGSTRNVQIITDDNVNENDNLRNGS